MKEFCYFYVYIFNVFYKKIKKMIARIWHGYTTKYNAVIYEHLLKEEIFVEIKKKKIKGYKGIQLLKRDLQEEVEFTTIMWFDTIESVKQFAGDDYEKAHVPAKARKVLERFEDRSTHCELLHESLFNILARAE